MKKNIIFVGDSYCSSFSKAMLLHDPDQQHSLNDAWVDLVSNHFDLDLYCFGYSGKSWYYSRYMWYNSMQGLPDMLPDAEALIFVHTDCYRYNSCDPDVSVALGASNPSDPNQNLRTAFKYWRSYLFDGTFQDWAQAAWFRELNDKILSCPDLKVLHFFTFPHTYKLLPPKLEGMVFTTPLVHLSLGELTGTDREVTLNGMSHDQRTNHFSRENNANLARVAIEAIENYQPGYYPIDPARFDLVNPNSFRWPEPGFGTR